jgi:hypothetical protein
MRSLCSFVIFCLFFPLLAYSQDTLYRSNGKVMPVVLVKVDSTSITYRQVGDTSSLIYIIDRTFVLKIAYSNGQTKSFAPTAQTGQNPISPIPDYKADTLRNSLSLNLFNLFFGLVTINYERFFGPGNFSIKVPLTIGFNKSNPSDESYPNNTYRDVRFSTGCGMYFYPATFGKTKYYAGASLEFGKNRDITEYYSNLNVYENVWVYSALVKGGVAFRLSMHMFLSIDAGLGIGIQHYNFSGNGNYHYTTNDAIFDYEAGLNIGYKF